MVVLLRAILPKSVVKKKFMCEWCKDLKKSVVGFASHVKKCAIEQKVIIFSIIYTTFIYANLLTWIYFLAGGQWKI